MSAQPRIVTDEPFDDASLDATIDAILTTFHQHGRLDHAHERMQHALHERLLANGCQGRQLRLLEVNLFGSLSGWMEYMLEERAAGRDVVPDFARHLRRAFMAHCREMEVEPSEGIGMAIELARSLMELAASFQRHLHIDETEDDEQPIGAAAGWGE